MNRINKFIKFLDIVDEKIGIGLGIDYEYITEENIDSLKKEFIEKFTVRHNYNNILNRLNENFNKSYMEILNEI
jgi:hypothetical protein